MTSNVCVCVGGGSYLVSRLALKRLNQKKGAPDTIAEPDHQPLGQAHFNSKYSEYSELRVHRFILDH